MATSLSLKCTLGRVYNTAKKDLEMRVVRTLSAELKGKRHHVFFDNFFTSDRLLQDLLVDDIYSCGTARKDRKGFPPELKQVKLPNRYSPCSMNQNLRLYTFIKYTLA